jgi:hypothetical protein
MKHHPYAVVARTFTIFAFFLFKCPFAQAYFLIFRALHVIEKAALKNILKNFQKMLDKIGKCAIVNPVEKCARTCSGLLLF